MTQKDTSCGSTCIILAQFLVISPSLLWIGRNISPQTTDEQRSAPASVTLPDLSSLAICRACLKLHWYNLCKQFQPIKLFPGEKSTMSLFQSSIHQLSLCKPLSGQGRAEGCVLRRHSVLLWQCGKTGTSWCSGIIIAPLALPLPTWSMFHKDLTHWCFEK